MRKSDADGLVDFHHLPGEAGAEIARRAVHDAEQRGKVVGQLRPTAEPTLSTYEKCISRLMPAQTGTTAWRCGSKWLRRCRSGGVVRLEKGPAVEEKPRLGAVVGRRRDCVGCVAAFGPDLREVFGAALDVLPGGGEREGEWRRLEPPAAFVGVAVGGLLYERGCVRTPRGGTQAGSPDRRT